MRVALQGWVHGRARLAITASALALLTAGVAVPQAAMAQAAPATRGVALDIPAQDLNAALLTLADRSGLQIVYDLDKVAGKRSRAVRGQHAPLDALSQLLAGSGLTFRTEGGNRVRLEAAPQTQSSAQPATGVIQLGTLRVEGGAGTAGGFGGAGDGSQGAEAVYRAPASTVHITREDLDRFGTTSAGDMLRGQAGVQIGDGRNGGALDVNIRGIQGQSRVAVTVDGSQQALDVYRGYAGTQQRSYIDPALISEVTVAKGPQVAASAGGAIGGAVSMTTLRADDILRTGQTFGVRLTGETWDNGLEPPHRSHAPGQNLFVLPRKDGGDLFGSASRAGSIALALRRDAFDLVAAYARRNQGNYLAGSEGYDRYRIFGYRGYEENSTAKSFAAGDEVLNTSAETQSALLKAEIRPADGHSLELSYRYYDAAIGEIMPSDIFRSGKAGVYQYPQGEVRMDSASARYRFNPADSDLIDLRANLWWTDTQTSQLTTVVAPVSEHFASDRNWTRLDNQRVGGDLSNTSTFYTGAGEFNLTLGAAFQTEDIRPQARVVITEHDINSNRVLRNGDREELTLSAQLDFKPTDTLQFWIGGRYSQFRSQDRNVLATAIRKDVYGRFISVESATDYGNMYWLPDAAGNFTDATDPRLNNGIVFGNTNNPFEGVRYNDFGVIDTTVYAPRLTPTVVGFSYGPKLSSRDSGFTPAVGVNYELAPDSFVYASYTEAMRMPSLFETSLGTLSVAPVAGVKPERSRSFEIGASTTRQGLLEADDRGSIKLAYFNTNIRDYITRYYDPSSWGYMTFSNAKSYKTSGLELQASYDTGQIFADFSATHYFETETCDPAFAARLRSIADQYTRTENTPDCTPGSYMGSYTNTQNPPEYAVNISVGARFFADRLTVGGRMVYTSDPTETLDKPWQTGATTPQLVYHAVALFDAFMKFKVTDDVVLNASVQNLGDRYYLDPLAQSFMPSPGRTFRLAVAAKF